MMTNMSTCLVYFITEGDDKENNTHIFIGSKIWGNQICVEAREAQNGPYGEEAHHQLHNSAKR